LPLGSGGHNLLVFNGSPAHVSALSRPGTRPGIRPVIHGGWRRDQPCCRAFPLPFGRRPLLAGHPVPPGGSAPLTIGLPRQDQRGPGRGFRVPHSWDTAGVGALYTPGTAVFPRPFRGPRSPPAASQRPAPVTPVLPPPRGARI